MVFALFSATIDPGFIPRCDDDDSADIVNFEYLTDCDEDYDQPTKKCPFLLSEASDVEEGVEEEEEEEQEP